MQGCRRRGGFGDDGAAAYDVEPRRAQADGFHRVGGLQDHQVRVAAGRDAVALQPEYPGRVLGNRHEARPHRVATGHHRHVQSHRGGVEHVGGAERIPGIHHAVLSERHRQPRRHQLGHPGHAAAFRIGVVAPLEDDVDQRIGDDPQLGLGHQRDQLADVVVVHGVHGGQVRSGDPAVEPQAPRFRRQRFDVTGHRVVAFVAMHVDHQPAIRGDLAEGADGGGAIGHGPLEMGNPADHLDALVERPCEVVPGVGRPQIAVLRERHQLEVEIRLDGFLDLEQRVHRQQPVVADIHMGADRQKPVTDRPVAIFKRPFGQGFSGQVRLELAPQRDPLEQRARCVDARKAVGQGGIHVEVGIDERRRHQASAGVDFPRRLGPDPWCDFGDPVLVDGDVDAGSAVWQVGVADDQIEHHRSSFRNGVSSAAGTGALRDMNAIATMVRTNGIIRNS